MTPPLIPFPSAQAGRGSADPAVLSFAIIYIVTSLKGLNVPALRMGTMDKDFRIWVEQAPRKRRCQRCDGEIAKGMMFVRLGVREKVRRSSCMCAQCFESVMGDLSDEFTVIKGPAEPSMPVAPSLMDHGPHCFCCGLSPERCQCGREAYR